ncbi:hypothetical protein HRTV-25_gp49 [Halorubrum tailed virus 25]|uniref:Uncharacterized protein n=1 Tax=Halorubrum tailed virus 25 TaxID=2878006 RepID=A0AAE9BXK9_9CAUD|nr:hypothetical protein M1M37_gp049 [Halorubrum tailed virus 25]UBF22630.1 hypothetical protein HRTV-25_gp49 [Halorubrum tailed virus 25]
MVNIDDTTIEQIQSVPGLQTALEVLGEANRKAHDEGRCVIDFYREDGGQLVISEVTDHVEALEDERN